MSESSAFIVELLKNDPSIGNEAIASACAAKGLACYPAAISLARKEAGVPGKRGRKSASASVDPAPNRARKAVASASSCEQSRSPKEGYSNSELQKFMSLATQMGVARFLGLAEVVLKM